MRYQKLLHQMIGMIVVLLLLVACGPSQAELNAQATQVAADLSATQTAEAPTNTPTATPTNTPTNTPTPEPTDTPTPTPEPPTPTPTPEPPTPTPPPMVIVSTPVPPIIIKDAYITTEGGKEKILPPVFSSGIETLNLEVEFDFIPDGTEVGVEVSGNRGNVELDTLFAVGFLRQAENTNAGTVIMYLRPKSGSFVDGPYQATFSINGTPAIQLNWTVGPISP